MSGTSMFSQQIKAAQAKGQTDKKSTTENGSVGNVSDVPTIPEGSPVLISSDSFHGKYIQPTITPACTPASVILPSHHLSQKMVDEFLIDTTSLTPTTDQTGQLAGQYAGTKQYTPTMTPASTPALSSHAPQASFTDSETTSNSFFLH